MSTTISRCGEWLGAPVNDEYVMLNVESGSYLALSRVAYRIWELVEEPQTMDTICAQLLRDYDVAPETCRAEVGIFLGELERLAAITIRSAD